MPIDQQLARQIRAEIQRITGRRYRIALDVLDDQSLRELLRLLRDLEFEQRRAVNRARFAPWR